MLLDDPTIMPDIIAVHESIQVSGSDQDYWTRISGKKGVTKDCFFHLPPADEYESPERGNSCGEHCCVPTNEYY